MADPTNGAPSAADAQEQQRTREEEAKAAEKCRLKAQHEKELEDRRRAELDNTVAHTAPAEPFPNTQVQEINRGHGSRVHLRHRVRRRAQDPVPRRRARARQCRQRHGGEAAAAPRARRRRRRPQEVVDPRLQERRRVHQPALARRISPRRLRLRPAGAGQGPGVPQVVPRGGADPRPVGDGRRAGHLRGAGLERHPVVRGRRRPGRHRALLLRLAARHAAAAHGVGGVQALGGLLQPGLAVRRVGHAMVAHRRELRQLHRRAGVPGRQVLRPAQPRRHHQGRRLHPRRREARAAQAGRDQARTHRHARHAHLLLRGRTGQDAARRARPIICVVCVCIVLIDRVRSRAW